jgi:hypothetical protein
LSRTELELLEKKVEETARSGLISIAKSLFKDSVIWPLQYSCFYLGHVPCLEQHILADTSLGDLTQR